MKILLAEDEDRVSSFIKKGLEEQGHQVTQAFDGTTGLKLANQDDFDVIILDVIMPGMNGIEVCDQLKNHQKNDTPILMLTALGTTDDIVTGLETGADDYLSKPFKFKELIARINALYRRGNTTTTNRNQLLKIQDLVMDLKTKHVHKNNVEIILTAREFKLLEYLLKNKIEWYPGPIFLKMYGR